MVVVVVVVVVVGSVVVVVVVVVVVLEAISRIFSALKGVVGGVGHPVNSVVALKNTHIALLKKVRDQHNNGAPRCE